MKVQRAPLQASSRCRLLLPPPLHAAAAAAATPAATAAATRSVNYRGGVAGVPR